MVQDVKTTKPISTISFNTLPYLVNRLEELISCKVITFYAFIKHKSEDDEGGKKDHIHVYIEPSKMLQTDDLRNQFNEFVSADIPPLRCLPFQTSKFADWFMYELHDKRYLAAKGQTRRFHYSIADFITSDDDYFLFKYRQIDMTSLTPYQSIIEAQESGLTWDEYFRRGLIPLPQLSLYRIAWDTLLRTYTYRNGRPGHPNIDADTGEIIENDSTP